MDRILYPPTEGDLVYDWAEKWLEFIKLINEVTGTDEPLWFIPTSY